MKKDKRKMTKTVNPKLFSVIPSPDFSGRRNPTRDHFIPILGIRDDGLPFYWELVLGNWKLFVIWVLPVPLVKPSSLPGILPFQSFIQPIQKHIIA